MSGHKIITIIIFLLNINYSYAEMLPKPTKLDNRLLEVNYNENQVYKVKMQVGINSHLIFSEGEIFEKWYSGDNKAFVLTSHKNYVIFKPIVEKSKTNIFIITNKRHYNLSVQISRNSGFYGVRFRYPVEERIAKHKEKMDKENRDNFKKALMLANNPDAQKYKNKEYWAAGSNIIRPDKVFDNGAKTFFHFPEHKEFPAIYRFVDDGKGKVKEKLTQFTVNKNWIIVPKIQKTWRLRLGTAVLCIENRLFLPNRRDKLSQTASDNVSREMKMKEEF